MQWPTREALVSNTEKYKDEGGEVVGRTLKRTTLVVARRVRGNLPFPKNREQDNPDGMHWEEEIRCCL